MYLLIESKQFMDCLTTTDETMPYPHGLKTAEPVVDLFVTLNSAANVVVYTCMSQQFRVVV